MSDDTPWDDELDRRGRAAAAALTQEAARVADTEQALADLHDCVHRVTALPPTRRRWEPLAAAAAVAAVLVGATAVLLGRNGDDGTVEVTPITDESVVPASTTTSTMTAATAILRRLGSLDLGAGMSIDPAVLGFVPAEVRQMEANVPFWEEAPGQVVSHRTELIAADGTGVAITLVAVRNAGDDPTAAQRPAVAGDDSLMISVKQIEPVDPSAAPPGLRLQPVADAVVFDPAGDRRTQTTVATASWPPPAVCTSDGEATGAAERELVLFLCDGTLGHFASDGELIETIATFDAWNAPQPDEGPGNSYVDGITVSPDGATVLYSTGPEPAVGTVYRVVLGSGDEPTLFAFGLGPAFSPDGTTVAAVTLDGITLFSTEPPEGGASATVLRSIPLWGTFPAALVWSPDGTQISFEAGGGLVGTVDLATGGVELRGVPVEQLGCGYFAPSYDPDGTLRVTLDCGDAGVEGAVPGGPGNQPSLESSGSGEATERPVRHVPVAGEFGQQLVNTTLGSPDAPWATGVLEAAVIPT
jgi:hypothetical protein